MNLEPGRRHYVAVFLLSLCLLVLEIAVARVLSVALFSHFAFVAVSLAMFGIGLSGLVVYLLPGHFRAERLDAQLAAYAAGFGAAAALAMAAFLRIHVVQELSPRGFATLSLAYLVLAVPFFLGGICISLLMTHFSARIARIYWADLVGASLGCVAVVAAMQLMPAPQVAVLAGAIAAAVGLGLARVGRSPTLALPAAAVLVAAGVLVAGLSGDFLRMRHVKSWNVVYSTAEAWNAFSRVAAFPSNKNAAQLLPLKRGVDAYAGDDYPPSMNLDIDGGAWTPMMGFDGDLSKLQFLRESVLYAAHQVRPGAAVLIIGTGGGRDLLAAKVFEQPSIRGIEINPLMRHMVQDVFGDYSGRVYTLPGIGVVIDEARSRLSTLPDRFGVIQLSLIDTFSLNAAGGFVFSENYLYTLEGVREYFRHLTDDGILSISRYFSPHYTLEIVRVLGMVRAAWEAEGARDVRGSIVVLTQGNAATVLAKRTPFTPDELARLHAAAAANDMSVLYEPGVDNPLDAGIGHIVRAPDLQAFIDGYPYLVGPPTDDRPFFFHFLRGRLAPGDVPDEKLDPFQFMRQWNDAQLMMYLLIAVVTVLAAAFFLAPLLVLARRPTGVVPAMVAAPALLYFACLGYGFMMLEIPLLQRFVLFLGYPVYALAVVLFALLLFSGTGSLLSARFQAPPGVALTRVLLAIVALALVYIATVPGVIAALIGTPLALRIGLTVLLLAPIGLLLGMAYPLGITVLRTFGPELVPWAWGLNGALSVVASVFAIFLGSRFGFSAAFLTGVAAYAIGLAAITLATRAAVAARGA